MSNLPATTSGTAPIGLEDFDESDLIMPRLDIASKEGVFIDNLSNERLTVIEGVALGVVKGRIMWDPDQNDKFPWCKSVDFNHGHPHPEKFPWGASGFSKADYVSLGVNGAADTVTPLNCADCPLKEWGTHPKTGAPFCGEQHTYIIMQPIVNEVGETGWSPITMTVQRTSLPASKAYMNAFNRTQTPMFIARTSISLEMRKKGSNDYSVAVFQRGGPTDPADHDLFARTYIRIRTFLRTPRRFQEDEAEVETTPQSASAQAPAPEPAPAAAPVQEPPVVVQPVSEPVPAPVAPVIETTAAPVATPPVMPVAQPAPVAPVAEHQPTQAAPVVQGPSDDDLPF